MAASGEHLHRLGVSLLSSLGTAEEKPTKDEGKFSSEIHDVINAFVSVADQKCSTPSFVTALTSDHQKASRDSETSTRAPSNGLKSLIANLVTANVHLGPENKRKKTTAYSMSP